MFDRIRILRYTNIYLFGIPEEDIRNVELTIGILALINNGLRDIPVGIARLRNLQMLLVCENPIQFFPDFLFSLDYLDCLLISESLITYVPDVIVNLRNLTVLSLPRNHIEFVSPHVFNMAKLTCLRLNNNNIKGLYLPINYQPGNLKLYLTGNPLSEEDFPNGMVGKKTLRRIFGKNVCFTKEEEDADLNQGELGCCGKFGIFLLFFVIFAAIGAIFE